MNLSHFIAIFYFIQQIICVSPRFGNAGSLFPNSSLMFLTGGSSEGPMVFYSSQINGYDTVTFPEENIYNDLMVYDLDASAFLDGEFPSFSCPRVYHTSVVINDSIYLFGGAKENNQVETFEVLLNGDSVVGSWSVVNVTSGMPRGRYGHGASVLNGEMWIFGGFDGGSGEPLNDLWTFNPTPGVWKQITTMVNTKPSPRGGMVFQHVERNGYNYMLSFGGSDNHNHFSNQLWGFNVDLNQWENWTPLSSVLPAGRSFASSATAGSILILFGGMNTAPNNALNFMNDLWFLDFEVTTPSWTQVDPNPRKSWPPARADAVAVYSPDSDFTVFSGSDGGFQTRADIWTFNWLTFLWNQRPCFPGYEFPFCVLNCRTDNFCSGHGTCLENGTCYCDLGWSGSMCDLSTCQTYLGFNTDEMNQVLLPAAIEIIYTKLNATLEKLLTIRNLLPQISQNQINLTQLAFETYSFYKFCLADNLCPVSENFEDVIGCEAPCGSETICVQNDICVNGQCIGGVSSNCSATYNNRCVRSWCDPQYGCMYKALDCEDFNPCTVDYCDSVDGCVSMPLNVSDGDCCTIDQCQVVNGNAQVTHTFKCNDLNPCTRDFCETECSYGKCFYECIECCYSSEGQTIPLNPPNTDLQNSPRPLGNPLLLTGENNYPPNNSTSTAEAFFWLKKCDCQLLYNITITNVFPPGTPEEGAAIYGPRAYNMQGQLQPTAGVIYLLPRGPSKVGSWDFCAQGIDGDDILNGLFYVVINFCSGDIRANITFSPNTCQP